MNFSLTPPSGYSDSYYDVQFTVEFDKCDTANIFIRNITTREETKILGVTNGVIQNECVISVQNSNKVTGYMNLFNDDKMNSRLHEFDWVDIHCRVETTIDSNLKTEERVVRFYNEGLSLDSGILPFDVILRKPLDIINKSPLSLVFVCNSEKKVEFCIRRESSVNPNWHFEAILRKGQTQVDIPVEILFHELEGAVNSGPFILYYVQFEGFDYSGFINRKYIPVHNISIKFNSRLMPIKGQLRKGPDGSDLSEEFVLSPDYFVHTHKSFIDLPEQPKEHMSNMSRFLFEALDMRERTMSLTVSSQHVGSETAITETLQQEAFKKGSIGIPPPVLKPYLTAFAVAAPQPSMMPFTTAPAPKKSGCGCSRKKTDV